MGSWDVAGIWRLGMEKRLVGMVKLKVPYMKIAISTDNGQVAAHFGRCPEYTIVEIEKGAVTSKEVIPNPGHQPGFLPQFLHEKGVNCIIAGGMGPRAQEMFVERGIQTVVGVSGSVEEVIEKILVGKLEGGESLCTHPNERGGS